jgi:hypothetical protein
MAKQCIKNAAHPVSELRRNRRSVSPGALDHDPRASLIARRLAWPISNSCNRNDNHTMRDPTAMLFGPSTWREVTTRFAAIERGSCLISRFPMTLVARELDEHISAPKSDVLGSSIRENHGHQSSLASSDRSRSHLHNAV